jgi:hypothetical protein
MLSVADCTSVIMIAGRKSGSQFERQFRFINTIIYDPLI